MGPSNQELSILLSLRDEVSAKWAMLTGKMASSSRDLVASVKANWLAMSAGAVAAFAIISKAWDWTEEFVKNEQAKATFKSMVESMGQDATRVFNDINQKAAGLIDDNDIVAASNRAMSLGVPVEHLGDLMLIARAKSRDLGITAKEGFDLITEAVGKSSQRKLKEIGLTIDLRKESDFLTATLTAGAEALSRQNLAMFTTFERMQQIRTSIEEIKDAGREWVTRIEAWLFGLWNLMEVGAGRLIEAFLVPLAMIEQGMRSLGLTTSFTFKHLLDDTMEGIKHFSDEARKGFDVASASSRDLAGAMGGAKVGAKDLSDNVSDLTRNLSEIPVEGITFVTREQEERFQKIFTDMQRIRAFAAQSPAIRQSLLNEQNAFTKGTIEKVTVTVELLRGMTDEMLKDLQEKQQAMASFVGSLAGVIGATFTDMFSNTEGVGKAFLKRILIMIIDMVQVALLAAAAMAPLKGVLSFGLTVAPDLGALIAATALLQLARVAVASFHQGGVVPKAHGGMYIDAPTNREFPIMVRGGETVRTEAQEAALRGNTQSVIIQINGPIATKEAFKKIVQDGMREMGITDVTRYFKNHHTAAAI